MAANPLVLQQIQACVDALVIVAAHVAQRQSNATVEYVPGNQYNSMDSISSESETDDDSSIFSTDSSSTTSLATIDDPTFDILAFPIDFGEPAAVAGHSYMIAVLMSALIVSATQWSWSQLNDVVDFLGARNRLPVAWLENLKYRTLCDCNPRGDVVVRCSQCQEKMCQVSSIELSVT